MEKPGFSKATSALNYVLEQQNPPPVIVEPSSPTDHNEFDSETYSERTVIEVQPQRDGGSEMRQPFPIIAEWQTLDVRQLNPQWGLQLLADREQVLIQQTVELDQLTSTVTPENRYVVRVPNGMTLFMGSEYSSAWQRLCCGSSRAFSLHLLDPTKQEALVLIRRLAGTVGCFVQKIELYIPSGIYIGCVKQQPTVIVPNFTIQNASDVDLFTIEGPRCCACSMFTDASFQVKSSSDGTQLGSITHFCQDRSGNYELLIIFPSRNTDSRTKALILAAGFLLEYMFFESSKSFRRCLCFKRGV